VGPTGGPVLLGKLPVKGSRGGTGPYDLGAARESRSKCESKHGGLDGLVLITQKVDTERPMMEVLDFRPAERKGRTYAVDTGL